MTNLVNVDRWSLGRAARAMGADPATVWRWCKVGVKVEGERIWLNYHRIGRRLFTTETACNEFIAAVTRADMGNRESTAESISIDPDIEARLQAAGL